MGTVRSKFLQLNPPQPLSVTPADRASIKGQRACVVWFTGLSGAGKSTIANIVEKRLWDAGHHTCLLDADNLRRALNDDLAFTAADRTENIRRIGHVSRLMVQAGLIVLVAAISPYRADRLIARSLVRHGEFIEVFVDVPLALAEERDPKGFYKMARRGELPGFTGIDSGYEPPRHPEVHIDGAVISAQQAAEIVLACLERFQMSALPPEQPADGSD